MPSWAIHLAVATKLSKKLNLNNKNKNIFLLGNLAPDILNGYVVTKISHKIPHDISHYQKKIQIKSHQEKRYDLEKFYNENKKNFSNPIVLGYYTHLLTDFYWNNLTYEKKGIKNEEEFLIGLNLQNGEKIYDQKDKLRRIKTNDFKIFSNYIYKNKLAEIPTYDEDMMKYAKEMDFIDLEKEDILETIKYLEKISNFEVEILLENKRYQIFSEQEMLENLDFCAKFIENKLNN